MNWDQTVTELKLRRCSRVAPPYAESPVALASEGLARLPYPGVHSCAQNHCDLQAPWPGLHAHPAPNCSCLTSGCLHFERRNGGIIRKGQA